MFHYQGGLTKLPFRRSKIHVFPRFRLFVQVCSGWSGRIVTGQTGTISDCMICLLATTRQYVACTCLVTFHRFLWWEDRIHYIPCNQSPAASAPAPAPLLTLASVHLVTPTFFSCSCYNSSSNFRSNISVFYC